MAQVTDTIRFAVAQLDSIVGDIDGNLKKARAARASAAGAGADLLVLSELFIAGYPPEDLVLKPAFQDACRAAVEALAPVLSPGRATLLLGVMADKEVDLMLAALRTSPRLRDARLIAVTVPDAPRSLSGAELASRWRVIGGQAEASEDLAGAWTQAVASARAEDGPLVVAGSLYLVGAIRALVHPTEDAG